MAQLPPIKEMPDEQWQEDPAYPMDYKPPTEEGAQEAKEAKEETADSPESPETPQEAPEGDSAPEGEAEPTQEAKDAKAWKALEESFGRNPVGFVSQLLSTMTPDQRQAFLQQNAPPPQEADWTNSFRPDDELTTEELFVKRSVAPQLQASQKFQQDVTGWTVQAAQVFNQQSEQIVRLGETVAALQKELASMKGEQQKAAVRTPKTIRNGAGSEARENRIPDDANMVDIFTALKKRGGG